MTTQPFTFGGLDTAGRQTTFKCKKCKGTLRGGATHDAVRARTGGYMHPDPPGCKHFKDLEAQAKRDAAALIKKPPSESSGSRRDDEKRARILSRPARKPPSSMAAPVDHPPRVCAREGCGTEFKPSRSFQKYCSPACREQVTAENSVHRQRENAKRAEERKQQRIEEEAEQDRKVKAGEHVHTGGVSHRGALVCHNGTSECEVWEAQQPHVCALTSCNNVIKPKKPGHVQKYCSRECSARSQGEWHLAAQTPPPVNTSQGVGWPQSMGGNSGMNLVWPPN